MNSSRPYAALEFDLIDVHKVGLTARGVFDHRCRQLVQQRLDRLIAAGTEHVRIDLSNVTSLETSVAEVFRRAAAQLEARGGSMSTVGSSPAVAAALGQRVLTNSPQSVPTGRTRSPALAVVAPT